MNLDRRALIVGAGVAVAAPKLVRATNLLDIPGDPLAARGLMAAQKWATDGFCERPGCRVVFADGQTTKWMVYNCMSRGTADGGRTHVVAIEAVTTDEHGKRFITSIPVDGARVECSQKRAAEDAAERWRLWSSAEREPLPNEVNPPFPWPGDEIPF